MARAAWAGWFDLFTPAADGSRPGLDRWSADMPVPTRADLRDYPFLNPSAFVPSLTLARMWRSAKRYFGAAISQKTLLPRGVYRVDRFRNAMARLWGSRPGAQENPGGDGN